MDTPLQNIRETKPETYRDSIATVDKEGKRIWIYPQKPRGRLYDYHTAVSFLFLGVFFLLPFVKVNGEPLFLFNVLERKFILFGMIFWPQDFFLFGLGMLIFIVFIALFTVVYGRVFCGWVCPQTIFMEMVFRKVEYWIEGDAVYQKTLSKMPWNRGKIIKKTLKYFVFFLISWLIANTFLSYIIGVDEVLKIAREPVSQHRGGFISLLIFTGIFFFVFSWLREQACLIVCPYGRMQGVLMDKNSVIVAYDYVRGEPRHKFKKNEARGKGDCIDCSLCVKVCPTGIDIRNGTQLECVNCTACIDACDHMMDSVGLPKGLIRYDSENGIALGKKLKFTGRMKAYSAVLLALVGLEIFLLASRSDLDATVLRAKGLLYQEQAGNQISNLYTIKLINKTRNKMPVSLKVENYPASIKMVGRDLAVEKEGMEEGEFFVLLDKKLVTQRKTRLEIGIYANNKRIRTVKTNFLGPATKIN